jgi:hypothetical protein
MKLTDTTAAGLRMPPGKSEHFLWDESLPGLGVRLRQGAAQAEPSRTLVRSIQGQRPATP